MCSWSFGPGFFSVAPTEIGRKGIISYRPIVRTHLPSVLLAGCKATASTPAARTSEATTPVGGHHSVGAMAFARSHSRSSMSMTESSLSSQLSRRQSSIDSWKRTASNLRRWFAEYEEKSIRALISRQDGKSNEQILSVWKLRKTAGNWRSLILTSEAIYDATLGHRSCKRRCHLATVRAITACTASGQFLIHIDETYDTLYVDRKKQAAVIDGVVQAAARFRAVDVPHMKE